MTEERKVTIELTESDAHDICESMKLNYTLKPWSMISRRNFDRRFVDTFVKTFGDSFLEYYDDKE